MLTRALLATAVTLATLTTAGAADAWHDISQVDRLTDKRAEAASLVSDEAALGVACNPPELIVGVIFTVKNPRLKGGKVWIHYRFDSEEPVKVPGIGVDNFAQFVDHSGITGPFLKRLDQGGALYVRVQEVDGADYVDADFDVVGPDAVTATAAARAQCP